MRAFDPKLPIDIEFCCGAQRASLVAYGRRPMGGLGETALRYEP
jgi:hypothetical protein